MKKMRKLIPAFAMLMVAAIMMSTASFAWFTMNEAVTATGMNIQAQAGGSLVIKMNSALTASDTDINVDFADASANLITPVTYIPGADGVAGSWQVPSNGAGVDSFGVNSGTFDTITPEEGTHYIEYVVYLAVAGDELDDQILSAKVEAVANANMYIAPAYTVAFYVGDNDNINAPDAVINVLNGGTATLVKNEVDLPSTVGIEAGHEVGVKVTMRVFVDGELSNVAGTNQTETVYKQATGFYVAGTTYYTDNTGATTVNTTSFEEGVTDVSTYYVKGTDTVNHPTKYVNSNNGPLDGTTLRVTFSVDETAEDNA